LVEDDPLIREFVIDALREQGFDVIPAAGGEQALAWCAQRAADVLVIDIRLPGRIDGWQIAERCREHDPNLPVIYATGFSPVSPRPVPRSFSVRKPTILPKSSERSRISRAQHVTVLRGMAINRLRLRWWPGER
jgi:DNA-binding NarL/FixJ family response regulator